MQMACGSGDLRVAVSSQLDLEGAAVCFRNLQCRSGPAMVLSPFLDGDFAIVMLSFCISLGPCVAHFYVSL